MSLEKQNEKSRALWEMVKKVKGTISAENKGTGSLFPLNNNPAQQQQQLYQKVKGTIWTQTALT